MVIFRNTFPALKVGTFNIRHSRPRPGVQVRIPLEGSQVTQNLFAECLMVKWGYCS